MKLSTKLKTLLFVKQVFKLSFANANKFYIALKIKLNYFKPGILDLNLKITQNFKKAK